MEFNFNVCYFYVKIKSKIFNFIYLYPQRSNWATAAKEIKYKTHGHNTSKYSRYSESQINNFGLVIINSKDKKRDSKIDK